MHAIITSDRVAIMTMSKRMILLAKLSLCFLMSFAKVASPHKKIEGAFSPSILQY